MRPGILASAVAITLQTILPAAFAAPVSTSAAMQGPSSSFVAWTLGRFKVVALNDGTAQVPFDKLLHGLPQPQIRADYAKAQLALPAPNSFNAFLIDTGTRRILIDSGNGAMQGPDVGHLKSNLAAAGYRPDQIDLVLLTHFHSDHIGGLTTNGKPTFANAVIRADRHETDYWLSPAGETAARADDKERFRTVRAVFGPYQALGHLKPFDGATELAPGIRSVPAYGHTPGHSAYIVESQGHSLLVFGDIVHAAPVQFSNPDVTIAWDWDEGKARTVRMKLFAMAAKENLWVAGAHLPFPGVGHIRAKGQAFAFLPAVPGQR